MIDHSKLMEILMKKMLSAILLLCLTANVFATSHLEAVMDDFQYAMAVEWDQKDIKFQAAQTKKLIAGLEASGASTEELLALVEKKVPNKKMVEAIKLKLSLKNISSEQEIAQVVAESSKDFGVKGASWNGDVVSNVGVVLVVAVLAYAVYRAVAYECVETEYQFTCRGSVVDGSDRCFYADVCVRSEKKD